MAVGDGAWEDILGVGGDGEQEEESQYAEQDIGVLHSIYYMRVNDFMGCCLLYLYFLWAFLKPGWRNSINYG